MGEGGEGGEVGCHLPRSLPQVTRAEGGGMGAAVKEVRHRVLPHAAPRTHRGGGPANPMEEIPHGRGETRPQLRKGGPSGAGEVSFAGANWWGGPAEDSVWGSRRNGVGYSLPVDVRQGLTVRGHRGNSIL